MIKQKKSLIAGGVVAALACAWWGLGVYASGKAEDELLALLDKTGQRDMVHWKSISASPFGSAKLKEVTIGSAAFDGSFAPRKGLLRSQLLDILAASQG